MNIGNKFVKVDLSVRFWWKIIVCAWTLCLMACHAPAKNIISVNHVGPPIHVSSEDDLLKKVFLANDAFGTMKMVHQVAIEIAIGGGHSEKRKFKAILAIRRPAYFRLFILGPMDTKLIDLGYAAGKVKTFFIAPEFLRASRLPEIIQSMAKDIATIYRLDPQPLVDKRRMEDNRALSSGRSPFYILKEYYRGELIRKMSIFTASLAIARTEVIDDQHHNRNITYGDYEAWGNLLIPRSIQLAKEGPIFYWLTIRVDSVLVDQPLDEQLFNME